MNEICNRTQNRTQKAQGLGFRRIGQEKWMMIFMTVCRRGLRCMIVRAAFIKVEFLANRSRELTFLGHSATFHGLNVDETVRVEPAAALTSSLSCFQFREPKDFHFQKKIWSTPPSSSSSSSSPRPSPSPHLHFQFCPGALVVSHESANGRAITVNLHSQINYHFNWFWLSLWGLLLMNLNTPPFPIWPEREEGGQQRHCLTVGPPPNCGFCSKRDRSAAEVNASLFHASTFHKKG